MNGIQQFLSFSQRALLTPVGLAILVVHWIVVVFAFTGDMAEPGIGNYTLLPYYLSIVNAVPLALAFAASSLFKPVVPNQAWLTMYLILTSIFASFQCLLLGSVIQVLWDQKGPIRSIRPDGG